MTELIFATNNAHKLSEIAEAVKSDFKILSLADIGFTDDIAETENTLEGNALLKAKHIHNLFHKNCFADDTGLEVEALDGMPGVYSARYAGPGHNHEKNMDKLLDELINKENRKARFRTVISLIFNEKVHSFEGIVNGSILNEKHGKEGFGYDPVFQPDGYTLSFAEMDLTEKNKISHRGIAVRKLIAFLKENA